MSGDKLVSIGQAARMLGVHSDTLRRWESEGKIQALRTRGGHRRYRVSDIQAILDRQGGERVLTVPVDADLLALTHEVSERQDVSMRDLVEEGLRVATRQRPDVPFRGNSSVRALVQKEDEDE